MSSGVGACTCGAPARGRPPCDGRAAPCFSVHLTLSGGEAELELLEGGETGSSSLHTSLFKGTIKVWQKCQCCRQGTGL